MTQLFAPTSQMFISSDELKVSLYEYRMNQIADNDIEVIEQAILAAISEVRGYFLAANQRRETANLSKQQYAAWKLYDVDAIFNARGTSRDPFVMRLVSRVATYNLCELSNVDTIFNHVKERYDNTIKTLEKIAGMGEYATSRIVLSNLPSLPDSSTGNNAPFRMVSRPKFQHE